MSPDPSRESSLSASFVAPTASSIGGLKFRKFSIGSLAAAQAMNLSLVTTPGAADELTPREKQRQCMAIAWMQCAPLDEVLDAVESSTWARAVARFEMSVDLDALPQFIAEITRTMKSAARAAVEVQPRQNGDASKEEQAPGNS